MGSQFWPNSPDEFRGGHLVRFFFQHKRAIKAEWRAFFSGWRKRGPGLSCEMGGRMLEIQVHLALLLSQLLAASATVLSQHVLSSMDQVIYSLYGSLAALGALLPIASFTERDTPVHNVSLETLPRLLLLGLLFFVSQILSMTGIKNTSANFFTAMQPSIPVFGTAIAVLMRVEKLNWPSREGQAKVAGICLCCAGATVMALWNGPCIIGTPNSQTIVEVVKFTPSWNFGVLCILLYCLCTSLNGCILASLLAQFPKAPITVTACQVAIGSIFLGATGAFHGWSAWKVAPTNLVVVAYNGLFGAAFAAMLIAWSIGQVGPILVSCYIPVQPAVSQLLSLLLLKTGIYLGSILGASLVGAGLLVISWSREKSLTRETEPLLP